MVAFSFFPSVISCLLWGIVYRKYESPVWLVRQNHLQEAAKVLEDLKYAVTK